jgi:hypothetical protein
MREHASYYKQFIDVQPGGGQRRNPKRKNAGVYSTPTSFTPPTPDEIDRVFESHLGSMARGGTYGDNMEISAFAAAFGIDVKIYQHDFAYMVAEPDQGTPRPVAHIAYHVRSGQFIQRRSALRKLSPTNICNRLGSTIHQYETLMDHILDFQMFRRRPSPPRMMPKTRLQRPKSHMCYHGWSML